MTQSSLSLSANLNNLILDDYSSINLSIVDVKTNGSKVMLPMVIDRKGDKLWLKYPFSKTLTDELKKNLAGMKWHGYDKKPIKQWSCDYCEHNLFRFEYLSGRRPYSLYDSPCVDVGSPHPLKQHQRLMAGCWASRHGDIWAAEMGLGKSLAAIATIEYLYSIGSLTAKDKVWWVATKSALISVQLEYIKWKCKFPVEFMTYEGLKKRVETIASGTAPPRVIIGDEAHKLKHLTTQRTAAFAHVTRAMRHEYTPSDCWILLMTGTPAPKSPLDWYSLCEIVRPGYLKEGNIYSFKDRLAVIEQRQGAAGAFPELIGWRDNTDKCNVCGKGIEDYNHSGDNIEQHLYVNGVNEVELLFKRMNGLVIVKTKRECTDLPDKIYRKVYCKPKRSTLQAAQMITRTQTSTIKALTLLRQLSDGFQYCEEADGTKVCELCTGTGRYVNYVYCGPDKTTTFIESLIQSCRSSDVDSEKQRVANQLELALESAINIEDVIINPNDFPQYFKDELGDCVHCNGIGNVPNIIRSYKDTSTAKDAALIDIIEDHDDVGRLVIYAGFTAAVDRVTDIIKDRGWKYIRLDGRGWLSDLEGKPRDYITHFQNSTIDDKVAFVGNPGSAGTGLTLTASPTVCYYSNDFNADSRQQSEDRIHRIGMDECRGATIIDLIHLPTDDYVLDNLLRKKRLQDMSLGLLQEAVAKEHERNDYE